MKSVDKYFGIAAGLVVAALLIAFFFYAFETFPDKINEYAPRFN
nr:hypothetical protein [Paenibacillus xylanexedens]